MLILMVSAVVAVGPAAHAEGISGRYTVTGVEPTGRQYTTTAEVSMTGEASADITVEALGGPLHGVCMVTETEVACYGETGGGHYSIVVYERGPDGVLQGAWINSALRGLGQETLTPSR